jgi:F-type H+-transporting ATPase subunit b
MQEFLRQVPQWVETGLGIDTGKVLVQFISIAILFFFVYRFFWKPITNLLEERHQLVSTDLDEAKRANEDAHKIKEELKEQLLEAKTEAKNIIEASRERGENERTRIVEDAEYEAKSILRKAEDEIEREVAVARQNLKEEIVEVAYQMAEKIVEKEVDKAANDKTVKEVLKGTYNAK